VFSGDTVSRGHAALKHALQSHNRTLQLARYQTVDDVVNRFDFIQSREYRPSSPVHGDRAMGRRFPATLSGHPAAARGHKSADAFKTGDIVRYLSLSLFPWSGDSIISPHFSIFGHVKCFTGLYSSQFSDTVSPSFAKQTPRLLQC